MCTSQLGCWMLFCGVRLDTVHTVSLEALSRLVALLMVGSDLSSSSKISFNEMSCIYTESTSGSTSESINAYSFPTYKVSEKCVWSKWYQELKVVLGPMGHPPLLEATRLFVHNRCYAPHCVHERKPG